MKTDMNESGNNLISTDVKEVAPESKTPSYDTVVKESPDAYPYHDFTEAEEFEYKPKTGLGSKIPLKPILAVMFLILISIPAIYLTGKFRTGTIKPPGRKGEITWWSLGLKESEIRPLIDKYLEKNPGVVINFEDQSTIDYKERLSNSLSQGKGPDVFTYHNSWVPMFTNYLETLPNNIMTQDNFSKTFYPVIVRDMTTYDGIVGIPLEYDALTLFVNEDVLFSASKTPPRTWDEYRQLALELTTRGKQGLLIQSGAAMGTTKNVDYWAEILALLFLQNKVDLAKPGGTHAEEALAFFVDFYTFDKVWDSTFPASTEAFANGKLAMFLGPAKAAEDIIKMNPELRFKTVILPQVRRDDPNEPNMSYATYWVQGVWSRGSDKDLSWDFLKFLSEKENLEALRGNMIAQGRLGIIYPRIDMRDLLINDTIAGSVIALAPNAESWYMGTNNNDGPEGINTAFSKIYEGAILTLSTTKNRKILKATIEKAAQETSKLISKYGIVR